MKRHLQVLFLLVLTVGTSGCGFWRQWWHRGAPCADYGTTVQRPVTVAPSCTSGSCGVDEGIMYGPGAYGPGAYGPGVYGPYDGAVTVPALPGPEAQ